MKLAGDNNWFVSCNLMAITRFIVTDAYTEQTLRITLDAFAQTQQLEFKIESDIPVLIPRKDVFGLVTRNITDAVSFKQLTLTRVKKNPNLGKSHRHKIH